MNDAIYAAVKKYQEGDTESILIVLERFKPLLKSYSSKFDCDRDDAYSELQTHLLFVLKNINLYTLKSHSDGIFTVYINRTVRNCYIALSKKRSQLRSFVSIDDADDHFQTTCEIISHHDSFSDRLLIVDINRILSKREATIIRLIYIEGYSVSEVARQMGKSRQAINQSKKASLAKLRSHLQV